MKTTHKLNLLAGVLVCALAGMTSWAQTAPKMKMTTDIPASITTPDSVETRLGTLHFFDGFPDDATVAKVYDNLDFERGVEAFLTALPGASFIGALLCPSGVDPARSWPKPSSFPLKKNPTGREYSFSTMTF